MRFGQYPLSLALALLAAGCGSGDPASTANTAPSASDLTFEPSSAAVGASVSLSGSLTFADPDGNLSTLYLRFQALHGTG